MLVNMKDMLEKARREHYAVGLFNTIDSDKVEAVISAAEQTRSPVIIGTAEVLLPYGELKLMAPLMRDAAQRASVPVALHYDHGLTFERCIEALQLGFTSVMFDGSAGSAVENMEKTAEIVRIAHAMGATVEGEIGHVGEVENNDGEAVDLYTKPADAQAFVEATGVDALAVAIGTAHGVYKTTPKLDLARLGQLREALSVPLVLHGGSGLPDEDLQAAITGGIAKINIFTDLCVAGVKAMQESVEQDLEYLKIRQAKVEAIRLVAMEKMVLFGSAGKA